MDAGKDGLEHGGGNLPGGQLPWPGGQAKSDVVPLLAAAREAKSVTLAMIRELAIASYILSQATCRVVGEIIREQGQNIVKSVSLEGRAGF